MSASVPKNHHLADSRERDAFGFIFQVAVHPSSYRRVTGWTAEELRFDSRQGQKIVLRMVHTDSGAHPSSYLVAT
jgi:hypothetical protein